MTEDPMFLVSVNLFAAVLARCLKPNLLTAVLLGVVMIACGGYLGTNHSGEIMEALHHGRDLALTWTGNPPAWPPERNRTYPDLTLLDQEGNPTRLADFRGKVILVELVGMTCPACIAFSGGKEKGAFGNVQPQPNLEPLQEYVRRFGRIRIDDPRLVFVQIVVFNEEMKAPSVTDAKAWADHFEFRRDQNQYVLAGSPAMASFVSRQMVPGFQLIDKDFTLRIDCTGRENADNFYTDLLPEIRKLVKE
jgi:hypothetical protein